MGKLVAASILSADFKRLSEELKACENAGVDWIHFDVMDGCFVPNISFGIPVLESIRTASKLTFDIHLMILDPIRYIRQFRDAGADYITIHVEACTDLRKCVEEIHKTGAKAGVSLNPETPFKTVEQIIPRLDLILFMGVEPGFSGQKFNPAILPKIVAARKLIDEKKYKTLIEVDGGVNEKTSPDLLKAGTDVLVAGSYIFKHPQGITKAVESLRQKN